ncbi:uncharacterized protein YyaL (SSP411 family) [Natronocella acetinitrilica]|uniref:Uncharacterized protein YyaL (SSP411 family) n=1 Tax=Natronocella acetinitrilica TaxID=414046 RepID=A0AAE3G332_9GAMM|nr:thioredoxin domain-containing protein [Natronocella acetinitrilica]MCP1672987.1 uncharacterized protein YyaL (SSP411 family) [Natronocella acetinitrilica]
MSKEAPLSSMPIEQARADIAAAFDGHLGGFSDPPKYPQASTLDFLLARYGRHGDRQALHMACTTLRRMALGGINDQIGGGFARYSVDPWWMVPHFEKTLSDNALLLGLYADAYQATGDDFYARIARETAEWLLREMRDDQGSFYSTLAAESDGGEGRYYTWTPDEARRVLNAAEYRLIERRFGLDDDPNVGDRWHFHVYASVSELSKRLREPRDLVLERLRRARHKLYTARLRRPRPSLDQTVRTSWNALAVRTLARAGRILEEQHWIDAAEGAWQALHDTVCRADRVCSERRGEDIAKNGFLEDTAFMLTATLELLQSRWSDEALQLAQRLADDLVDDFQGEDGTLLATDAGGEAPVKDYATALADNGMPTATSAAVSGLRRLGCLLSEPRYLNAADRALRAAWDILEEQPGACPSLAQALDEHLHAPRQVVLRGEPADTSAWRRALERYYQPGLATYSLPPGAGADTTALADKQRDGDGCRAWVFRSSHHGPPLDSLDALLDTVYHRGGQA